ncbi:MAG TPA: hypothetical protein VI759_03735 [Dehalococcoidia bacterium]|nr:hypothetical protein [Dehalococcoidia bacterium]
MRLLGLIVAVVVSVVAISGVFGHESVSAAPLLSIGMTTKCIGNAHTEVSASGNVNGTGLYTECAGGGSQDSDSNLTTGEPGTASWSLDITVTDGRTGRSKTCHFEGTGLPSGWKTCKLPIKKPAPGGPTDHVGRVKIDGFGPIF